MSPGETAGGGSPSVVLEVEAMGHPHVTPPALLALVLLACSPAAPVSRDIPAPSARVVGGLVRRAAAVPRPPSVEPGAPALLPEAAPELPAVRPWTSWCSEVQQPLAKIDEARRLRLDVVKELFGAAQVKFPPGQMLLRAFKKERTLELWASSGAAEPLTHVTTYTICGLSGELGPKRRRGDGMVPEGFYTLSEYSPASAFHLAMLVTYPNLSDRILGARDPGDAIMIHGGCASIGCLAMSDERIQEIWVAATALRFAGGVVHVHIFPSRDLRELVAEAAHPQHRALWENLADGLEAFERRRVVPSIRIDRRGRYHFL